jgi:hypothetical protein
MDALTECRFLLNLVAYAKTLVTGYLATPQAQPAVTVRGFATVTTTYTVTDEAFIRLLFRRIYNEPFPYETFPEPNTPNVDERVADLITAFAAVPR